MIARDRFQSLLREPRSDPWTLLNRGRKHFIFKSDRRRLRSGDLTEPTCACSGAAFRGLYNSLDRVDAVIPVNAYIPGCAVRPDAVIDGVAKLLSALRGK